MPTSKAIAYNPFTEPIGKVLDIRQAADYLGCSNTTIELAIQRGNLRAYRPKGVRFIGRAMPLYHLRVDDLRHWFFGA